MSKGSLADPLGNVMLAVEFHLKMLSLVMYPMMPSVPGRKSSSMTSELASGRDVRVVGENVKILSFREASAKAISPLGPHLQATTSPLLGTN